MGLPEILADQSLVVTRRQALRFITESALRHRVASGRWQVPHRGVYAAHNGPITERQRLWIAVLFPGRTAYLSGLSVLILHGLRGLTARRIDAVLPLDYQATNAPVGVAVRRTRELPPDDRDRIDNLPCARPARAMIDAARWSRSDAEARTIVAVSFQQRIVRATDVDAALDRMPRVKRRSLIAATARDASGGAHSLGEVDFLRLCRQAGLPEPVCQARRIDASGRVRFLDACFEDWKLRVEIDGSHHLDVHQWWEDAQRDNDLWIAGERVLRFPAWVVRDRPDDVERQLLAALSAAGWPGGSSLGI